MSKIIRTRKPSVLPYYAAALAFVVLCAVLPVYRLWALLAAAGGRIEAVFFCPHAPEDDCACRKPAPGLFLDIARRVGVSPAQIVAAGDSVQHVSVGSIRPSR